MRKIAAVRLADERPGETLQASALVHEAYLRLVGGSQLQEWSGRGHFFAAAAEAMRRVMINRARDKNRLKRGGGRERVDLDALADPAAAPAPDLLARDDALTRLTGVNAPAAELVGLKFFAGLILHEAAALGIPPRTADRPGAWPTARCRAAGITTWCEARKSVNTAAPARYPPGRASHRRRAVAADRSPTTIPRTRRVPRSRATRTHRTSALVATKL